MEATRGLPAPLGAPLAFLYGAALVARNALAGDPGRAFVPVICVGNLSVGGTGKTPAAAWVVEVLKKAGRKPAILSRGYGRDETVLLARLCPEVPVVEEPDRVKGARAVAADGADVIVMDDGFQHRRLARDLDVVLVDATDPWGGGHLLPWGLLREPREALGRAGAVLITRTDQVSLGTLADVRKQVSDLAPKAVLAEAVHQPVEADEMKGRRVYAVCGIGNPGAFRRTLESLGARVEGFRGFGDHHAYTAADVEAVNTAAKGAEVVVTEKDWVKLEALPGVASWKALRIRLSVTRGEEALTALLRQAVGGS